MNTNGVLPRATALLWQYAAPALWVVLLGCTRYAWGPKSHTIPTGRATGRENTHRSGAGPSLSHASTGLRWFLTETHRKHCLNNTNISHMSVHLTVQCSSCVSRLDWKCSVPVLDGFGFIESTFKAFLSPFDNLKSIWPTKRETLLKRNKTCSLSSQKSPVLWCSDVF